MNRKEFDELYDDLKAIYPAKVEDTDEYLDQLDCFRTVIGAAYMQLAIDKKPVPSSVIAVLALKSSLILRR